MYNLTAISTYLSTQHKLSQQVMYKKNEMLKCLALN